MQSAVSPLEQQYVMFNDLIRVADEIIEQQTEIKQKTERMKLKNEELQTKSRELQAVLKSSQQQLLSDTSIPIELINQLALVVRTMKESHNAEFQELIALFNNVQSQFERQQKVFESSVKENGSEISERKEKIEEETLKSDQEKCEKVVSTEVSKTGAWRQQEARQKSSVTILHVKEEAKSCSSSADSPASHSEVVTSELLASLTRNADKGKARHEGS